MSGMPKYLMHASYTVDGAKGIFKDGGPKRRQAAEAALTSARRTFQAYYSAFGDSDAVINVDAPDHATIAGASIAINASGAVATKTTVLMTPEEVDQAVKKSVAYTPPGR